MIDLYIAATPNGYEASIPLEELGLDYETHVLDLGRRARLEPEFLRVNPNGKIPAIVRSGDAAPGPAGMNSRRVEENPCGSRSNCVCSPDNLNRPTIGIVP